MSKSKARDTSILFSLFSFNTASASQGDILSFNPVSGNIELQTPATTGVVQNSAAVFAGSIQEGEYTIIGANPVLSPTNGTIQTWVMLLSSSPTISMANGEYMTLMIKAGSLYTITWPTIKWVGGSAPTLATTGHTVIELWKTGNIIYGAHAGDV